jgi:hypothetical protein
MKIFAPCVVVRRSFFGEMVKNVVGVDGREMQLLKDK